MISAPFAHIAGIPIEETLGSLGPALLVASGWHGRSFAPACAGALRQRPRKKAARMTTMAATAGRAEQTRARYPDDEGYVECDGVRVFWELYGSGEPTVLLLPTWSIIHSRHWKGQIPYLARHARVLTFDGRGNGRSDRPDTVDAYAEREFAADALAVMDAAGVERAVVVGLSAGALWGVLLAAEHPERVAAAVFIARRRRRSPSTPRASRRRSTSRSSPTRAGTSTTATTGSRTTATSSSSSSGRCSPSRTRPSRSRTASGGAWRRRRRRSRSPTRPRAARSGRVHAPLRAHRVPRAGHPRDRGRGPAVRGGRRARAGHRWSARRAGGLRALPARARPGARQPPAARVRRPGPPPPSWPRGRSRRKRALYISSPIGLGHARRDIAIARELRACTPISRSTGSRSTPSPRRSTPRASACIRRAGCSPTSRTTSSPSRPSTTCTASRPGGGWTRSSSPTSWSSTTWSASSDYDLWIADEGWEIDYYLHENPEFKRAAYAWLTDFVGWLPMPTAGARGRPDGRLQRRDDRADRALPARARPRDLRRQPGRHRSRGVWTRASGDR